MGSILDRLKAGTANKKTTTWPNTDITIQIRILTEQDYHEASLAVDLIYKNAGIKIGVENVADYEAEKNIQLLYRAIIDPETNQHITKDLTTFRSILTKSSRDELIRLFKEFEMECSPNLNEISDEEFSSLYAEVKKNALLTTTNLSNINLAKKLIVTLVAELKN